MVNRIYYALKPFMPKGFRLAIRRLYTNRKLEKSRAIWPINEATATPPVGWPGWPDGKKFAVVLTHDVEGARGFARSPNLAALEAALGFRSSFNFIPEGEYEVAKDVRDKLKSQGFEIGVHDLKHNGKLYQSREEFRESAKRINGYLKEWGAVGFRGGFMIRNLTWIGLLDIKYDASTFDTDPFEPMPDGAETIFPFWIPRSKGGGGYIELPYSLPQDSTVFNLLGETSPEIWKRKLDWVASKGGMALLNIHPDYMSFDGRPPELGEFPAEYYQEFLQYVKTKHAGAYWHALPREVADYCEPFRPQRANRRPRRVCMLGYTFYESDNRVRRYTESLARRGDLVDVVTLRPEEKMKEPKSENGITVYEIQQRIHNEKSKLTYLFRLLRFCVVSGFFLRKQHKKKPYDLIHVHNVPDFLVIGALYPKLKGAKVILDIHDVVPEFYASKFDVTEEAISVRALKFIERKSTRWADHVIISNHLWFDKLTARSVPADQTSAFVNHVDQEIFYPRKRTRKDGKFILLFPGGLQWHQGLDLAIRAFGIIRDKAPEAEFHVYGDGNAKPDLLALTKELNLESRVLFFETRPLNDIPEIMANGDLGVVPKRANSFGNEAYSTKIMEFMSQGVPVVVSRTKIDTFYFTDDVVKFFESGNVEDLADAILTVIRNVSLRESLIKNGLAYVEKNSWAQKQREYLNLVDSLTA